MNKVTSIESGKRFQTQENRILELRKQIEETKRRVEDLDTILGNSTDVGKNEEINQEETALRLKLRIYLEELESLEKD
ncbi:MAG: hypothetical protein P4L74_03400 [Candidatus Doudnabacteria bacterium]|nr:hypothetical protein [Candidatus Doudnabacteria bacterium]